MNISLDSSNYLQLNNKRNELMTELRNLQPDFNALAQFAGKYCYICAQLDLLESIIPTEDTPQ